MHEPNCDCISCRFVNFVEQADEPTLRRVVEGLACLIAPKQLELLGVILLSEELGVTQDEHDRIILRNRARFSGVPEPFVKEFA